jgi:hypothetical protein
MAGRVVIYDYDQGMLVWRDLPDPSQQMMQGQVREYRKLGILGLATESRNAVATTFLNLYFRGQLYWNPDLDVAAETSQFYRNFYGPMTALGEYWDAIFAAWKNTDVTEHEIFAAPAIYTPELVARLDSLLAQARAQLKTAGNPEPFASRFQIVELEQGILRSWTRMNRLAATECDYAGATTAGLEGLAYRERLTQINGIFTTYRNLPEVGPAWWPGEVTNTRELGNMTLTGRTPLVWSYKADPYDEGLWRGWAANSTGWGTARTDLYLQGQGLALVDHHSQPGYGWYATDLVVKGSNPKLCFPGLFNEGWLYVNGSLVAHREQKPLWWLNDYAFRWDVPLSGLHPGLNHIALRTPLTHHFAGMFRRPFLR